MGSEDWKTFDLEELVRKKKAMKAPYLEFLRVPTLSCGIFGCGEDGGLIRLEGRGRLRVGDEERPVRKGSVLYVRATSEHSFFEIEEDMTLLVFFASGGPSSDAGG